MGEDWEKTREELKSDLGWKDASRSQPAEKPAGGLGSKEFKVQFDDELREPFRIAADRYESGDDWLTFYVGDDVVVRIDKMSVLCIHHLGDRA